MGVKIYKKQILFTKNIQNFKKIFVFVFVLK